MFEFILKNMLKDRDIVKIISERLFNEIMNLKVDDYAKLHNFIIRICSENKILCMKIYEISSVVQDACVFVLKNKKK